MLTAAAAAEGINATSKSHPATAKARAKAVSTVVSQEPGISAFAPLDSVGKLG